MKASNGFLEWKRLHDYHLPNFMKLKCLVCTVGLSILLISSGAAQSTFKFQNLVALGGIDAPVFDAEQPGTVYPRNQSDIRFIRLTWPD